MHKMLSYWGLVPLLLTLILSTGNCDVRRPIWNLGHMVNSVKQVGSFLDDGANGLEIDVTFSKNGIAEYTYHGVPCDCFRDCLRWEYFSTFLDYISEMTTVGHPRFRKSFVLLLMDLKMSRLSASAKETAIRDVAQKLAKDLYKNGNSGSRLRIVLTLQHGSDVKLVRVFHQTFQNAGVGNLLKNIGWEVYSSEDFFGIRHRWLVDGVTLNIWQGDGITNCLPRSSARLQQAIEMRNSASDSFMHKVYYWTVDKMSTMRSTLNMGVDAILTNHPARLRDVLNEGGIRNRFRLATYEDNPFETIKAEVKYQKMVIPQILVNADSDDVPEKTEPYKPLPISKY